MSREGIILDELAEMLDTLRDIEREISNDVVQVESNPDEAANDASVAVGSIENLINAFGGMS